MTTVGVEACRMHLLVYLLVAAGGSCLAHYGGEYDRNLIEREEPLLEDTSDMVECPVCETSDSWMSSHESCSVLRGGKRYKKCEFGTYTNDICGNRLDCYRGPGERCTEKMEYDVYGQRCAHGLYCNKALGVCTGLRGRNFAIDSNKQLLINPLYRYPLRARRNI